MAAPFAGRLALLLVAVAVCARADTEAYPSGTAAAGMAAATDCLQQPDCDPARSPRIKVLHEEARIFLYSRMLNDSECDHIIKLAEPHLMRSGVVDTTTGKESVDNVRTSKGMFLARSQDPVIASIEQRIAKWTLMPVGNGEGMQVLRYETGQEYEGHYDYFFHKDGIANGGNRYLTVLTYLNDVEEGGETTFPNIPAPGGDNGPEFSDCARKVLAVKPRKGDAVLFHSIKPTGELERLSLHSACPVIKGVKWSAPKWVHVGHFAEGPDEVPVAIEQKTQVDVNYPDCKDLDASCEAWANNGECDNNLAYMIGTKERPGHCIKSCGKCADFYEFKEDKTEL
ncbi:putative prolyl 4-hydroxylase 4 [Chlorella sorokiniana]|uniref:procollagen-proline 4-dioxygenase n=1 Tax=Chlorella sorokiniana TaxID=3076 RepID=A0A2P6TS56_CHLSO|nr:putative prolyl 4-hydroxylase 4 [Chlorella sorokiniana]|eukprot:PRW56888.1 putative prolyl 4-hydroxylase 4 [Chlorella sorokiniana]